MSGDDIIDAEWEEVPDSNEPHRSSVRPPWSFAAPDRRAHPHLPRKSFWQDTVVPYLKGLVYIVIIGVAGAYLFFLALALPAHRDHAPPEVASQSAPQAADQPASQPVPDASPTPRQAQQDGEQMLRSWTETVTGQADASGFVLVDGSGKPGEFCNNSDGDTMLKFGGDTTSYIPGITIFDFFAEFHGTTESGTIGAFWYDPSDRSLITRNQVVVSRDGKKGDSVPDIVHAFDADGAGRATIDGTRFHVCTI
ncbi:hypothetical protein [Novosphingobium sp. Leaf2]|uniref:hypothetical protein n=1 Tax=Novosphingobium sp. Leaf2 TaxID=1735670 RepID=UPI0006FED915|nr:hypothetical protein [Novosphingobium sp. Leaf2]KQM14680.1 hypothetical protein ASE49_10915 [Novosphingobium sp. Leaf2]